jgi:hypothetical protein
MFTDKKPKYQWLTEETLNKMELSLNVHLVNLLSIFHNERGESNWALRTATHY